MEERDGVDHEWSIVPLNDDYSPWKVLDENLPRESWDVGYENLSFGMGKIIIFISFFSKLRLAFYLLRITYA